MFAGTGRDGRAARRRHARPHRARRGHRDRARCRTGHEPRAIRATRRCTLDAPTRCARLPVRRRATARSDVWAMTRDRVAALALSAAAARIAAPASSRRRTRSRRCALGHSHGYRMAEFDVKLSADGVAFLLHDATLERTTNGRGRADALPWRELARLDAGGWHSRDVRRRAAADARRGRALVPRERRRAATSRSSRRPAASARPARRSRSTRASLWTRRRGAAAAVVVLRRSRSRRRSRRCPRCRARGSPRRCPPTGASAARRSAASRSTPSTRCCAPTSSTAAHAAGLRVAAWTVNDPARVAELASWGVDTIITDAVDTIT